MQSKGGACVALSKNFVLVGTWNSDLQMQTGKPQNAGDLNGRV